MSTRIVSAFLGLAGLVACSGIGPEEMVEVRFDVAATKAVSAEQWAVELRVVGDGVDERVMTGQSIELPVGEYSVSGRYVPEMGRVMGIAFGDDPWFCVDDEVSVRKDVSSYAVQGVWECWALMLGEGSAEYRCNGATIGMSGSVAYVPTGESDWTLTVVPVDGETWAATEVEIVSDEMVAGCRYVFRAGKLEQVAGFGVQLPDWDDR